jgi:hypothetical protein
VIKAGSHISGVAFLTPDMRAKLTSTTIFGKPQLSAIEESVGQANRDRDGEIAPN